MTVRTRLGFMAAILLTGCVITGCGATKTIPVNSAEQAYQAAERWIDNTGHTAADLAISLHGGHGVCLADTMKADGYACYFSESEATGSPTAYVSVSLTGVVRQDDRAGYEKLITYEGS